MRKIQALFLGLLMLAGMAEAGINDGRPFGPVTEQDVENLNRFAKERGVDLVAEVKAAYGHDEEALAKVFRFSTQFDKLDQNARTYGTIIYSSLLNIGESEWLPTYLRVLERQNPPVRQRVRDFLFYPLTLLPAGERADEEREIKKDQPALFPSDYKFNAEDPLWSQ